MGVEKKTKPKRNRICFTSAQTVAMEAVFQQSQYPDVTVLDQLAEVTQIPLSKLCTWFQNRRAKFRRESKNGHIKQMRAELYSYGQIPVDSPPVSPTEGASVLKKEPLTTPAACVHHYPCCTNHTAAESLQDSPYQYTQTAHSHYFQQLPQYQQQFVSYMQPTQYPVYPATQTTATATQTPASQWSQQAYQHHQHYDGYHGYLNQYNYYGMQQTTPDSREQSYSEIYPDSNLNPVLPESDLL